MKTVKNKIEENKEDKNNKLLTAALALFTEKGVKETSVQDIVDRAGVAKGTFYLYFTNKYEIQDYLISEKSKLLFKDAINSLNKKGINDFKDKIIYIIDYIIDQFIRNKLLLKFISKNLSWALYNDKISSIIASEGLGIRELFMEEIKKNNIKITNPELKLFMIIELTSSTVFTSITTKKPLPIKEFKPYLYEEIKTMLSN